VPLANRRDSGGLSHELLVLVPAVAVLILVSSQTGFTRYLRYVVPAFPFVFVWISKVGQAISLRQWKLATVVIASLCWSVTSSFAIYPYSVSYFNELAGGPLGGHAHLVDANIDWGQELLRLKHWMDKHPEARPMHLAAR
jgi:hypothetical protein